MIIDNSRLIKKLNPYNENEKYLDCETTTGTKKENNEDFAATVISPTNTDVALLVVCDGVGGSPYGIKASEFVVTNLVEWFNNFDFTNDLPENIEINVIKEIKKINRKLRKAYKESNTTLTMALIGKTKTLIINRGDSRTYSIKNHELTQITKDDSFVWKWLYKNGKGNYTKDDFRFLTLNSYITKSIGDNLCLKIDTHVIENNSYDGLLLLSDGVTDIVSDKRMEEILKEKEHLIFLRELLTEACYGESEFFQDGIQESLLKTPTTPGKDNATAAMYLKLTK